MAKKKTADKTNVVNITVDTTAENIDKATKRALWDDTEKTIEIKSAALRDDFCNYGYELKAGASAGDTVSRKGASIIHDDMKLAFAKLHVHLAVKCEEIDHTKIKDVEAIDKYDPDEHKEGSLEHRVSHFSVSEFKLEGSGEKEGVVLIGEKRLSTGDYVKLTTPKILWNGEYAFINELRVVVDDCIYEVDEYMNGKTKPKLVQAEMEFENPEEAGCKNWEVKVKEQKH